MSKKNNAVTDIPCETPSTVHQTTPFVVPTNDGKVIEEHFGAASVEAGDVSVAHMVAPAQWTEPYQIAQFDEIAYVIRGYYQVETDAGVIKVGPQESIMVRRGTRVRFSNPFSEECEYIAVCVPAFKPDRVTRFALA